MKDLIIACLTLLPVTSLRVSIRWVPVLYNKNSICSAYNFTPPSKFPKPVLIATAVLDLVVEFVQFLCLPMVPGILSIVLLQPDKIILHLLFGNLLFLPVDFFISVVNVFC